MFPGWPCPTSVPSVPSVLLTFLAPRAPTPRLPSNRPERPPYASLGRSEPRERRPRIKPQNIPKACRAETKPFNRRYAPTLQPVCPAPPAPAINLRRRRREEALKSPRPKFLHPPDNSAIHHSFCFPFSASSPWGWHIYSITIPIQIQAPSERHPLTAPPRAGIERFPTFVPTGTAENDAPRASTQR